MIRKLRELGRDNRGASIIELALIAPFFATMIVGVTDLSRGFSAKLQLTQAAQRSIEKVMQTSFQTSAVDTLKAEAAATAGVDVSAVDVDYWLQCNGVRQTGMDKDTAYNGVCPSSSPNYARYLVVNITKTYTPMFSRIKFAGANADGTYTLHGKAGIRVQ